MQPTFVAWRRPSIGCQPTLGGWCSSCRFLNPAFGGEGDRPRQVRPSVQFITGSARAFKAGPLASSEKISGPTSSVPSPGTARHQDRCRSRRERVCYCSNLHCYRARSLDPTRRATAHTAPPRERPQLAAATPRRWRRASLKSPKLRPLVPVVGSVTEWPGRSPAENLCHCALGAMLSERNHCDDHCLRQHRSNFGHNIEVMSKTGGNRRDANAERSRAGSGRSPAATTATTALRGAASVDRRDGASDACCVDGAR